MLYCANSFSSFNNGIKCNETGAVRVYIHSRKVSASSSGVILFSYQSRWDQQCCRSFRNVPHPHAGSFIHRFVIYSSIIFQPKNKRIPKQTQVLEFLEILLRKI